MAPGRIDREVCSRALGVTSRKLRDVLEAEITSVCADMENASTRLSSIAGSMQLRMQTPCQTWEPTVGSQFGAAAFS